jgi:hypothetical protein
VRLEVARAYAAMLSAGITPVVREYGSLGCSGDLAPLAHCAPAAMGEGTVRVAGQAGQGGAPGLGVLPHIDSGDARTVRPPSAPTPRAASASRRSRPIRFLLLSIMMRDWVSVPTT